MIFIKSERELEKMRVAGRKTARVMEEVGRAVKPGATPLELDRLAFEVMKREGTDSAFKGYLGYPAHVCISVNEEVVHGIPRARLFQEGDIVSVDLGVIWQGFYGDMARTFAVGKVSELSLRLMKVTCESLEKGIEQCVAGNRVGDISHAVEMWVTSHGFSVVRDLVGHGIGTKMHEDPPVPNFGEAGVGPKLKSGMVLAIEPMVNEGGFEVETLQDGWTVVTKDGKLSAHFENTVAITENGPEILTKL
ncbi:MAG: type I methionyl aminopeptidase [Chlamydiae bacterium]|nr:type I methionyl aminopeptidase [Chlamydiota bacterium]MBI3266302.1 type I methionyl aminopeptidase [Chlamydiota bacterium]